MTQSTPERTENSTGKARRVTERANGCVISAPTRSSGKTVISIGLAAAAHNRQRRIQCFKKGPDYIDPLWLSAASGVPCINLDPLLQAPGELEATFQRWSEDRYSLVEGSMGLHDGLLADCSDSNAALAARLGLPGLLVINAKGLNRTVAALLNGLVSFDRNVSFLGVILNHVRSSRHERKLCTAIEHYTDLPVLGVVPESASLIIDERELGLVPAVESDAVAARIQAITDVITSGCDVDRLFAHTTRDAVPEPPRTWPASDAGGSEAARYRVAVARDAAFQFYYHDDLELLAEKGVDLVEVSPLCGELPTDLDGLLLGGGFPERHAPTLAANRAFLNALRAAVHRGLVVHAECGGLMYLARGITVDGHYWPMVGVLPGRIALREKAVGRGYMALVPNLVPNDEADGNHSRHPSMAVDSTGINAHEFHHSTLTLDDDASPEYRYRVVRGHGIDGAFDGICVNNVIASYAHMRHTAQTPWIDAFLIRLKRARENRIPDQMPGYADYV